MNRAEWKKIYRELAAEIDILAEGIAPFQRCKCRNDPDCRHIYNTIRMTNLGKDFEAILDSGLVMGYTK